MARNGGEFSLAFGSGSSNKQRKKVNIHGDDDNQNKEVIVGFGEKGAETAEKKEVVVAKPTIAPLQNTIRNKKSFVPSYLPDKVEPDDISAKGIDKFEKVDEANQSDTSGIQYGLTKRREGKHEDGLSLAERETLMLKEDLRTLPPQASLEEYERMPVEAFGEALMRGMGWKEGRGIGRNVKGEVEAKELVRRPDRLGLGAAPAPVVVTQKRFIKPGESREKHDMVYVDESGAMKSSRPVDSKLQKRSELGVAVGKTMYIASGRHSGFECEIKSVEKGDREKAIVRLLPSMEIVTVRSEYLTDIGNKKDAKNRSSSGSSKRAKVEHRGGDTSRQEYHQEKPWLVPNIRVKIIDKKAERGRLYLKKGTVVDVKAPTICDIYVDDFQELFLDLRQHQLETSVPRAKGSAVMVVAGKYKGNKGTLIHRSKESDYVAIQLVDDPDIRKIHLDDIAEYTGV